ncbi:MAG: aminodeoxychorismate synthase component I, partial [Pyrinomonadaceae bacterium]
SLTSNLTQAEYEAAVSAIKDHIAAGDIYQANLTQQFTATIGDAAPEDIFLRLRREHPAPFSAFIRRTSDVVISGSPERFVRVTDSTDGRVAEAWPIKGTRPRGTTADGDVKLRAELLASEKDRAENVMIVDLLRNDLGRVAEFGSVTVEELFTLQEHPSLFHLVSKVRANLRPNVRMSDLLRAAFPCGSITGAPKIRAMEIIDELEPSPRGLSMGAIGYFGFDGTADLNVAIRTMTIRKGIAKFNVGGGIVADSEPAAEYDESMVKARSLMAALGN